MDKLRYEGLRIGDRIRAYDFRPRPGVRDRYVIGTIKRIVNEPYKAYVVDVITDTVFLDNERQEVLVPMETTMDYPDRVSLVSPNVDYAVRDAIFFFIRDCARFNGVIPTKDQKVAENALLSLAGLRPSNQ